MSILPRSSPRLERPIRLILGIESSCDETGLALYDIEQGLIAHRLHSQVDMHREFGGVVPELASRDHIRRTVALMEDLHPVLTKRAGGRDISGLSAYEQ